MEFEVIPTLFKGNPVTSETDLPKDNEGVEKDDNVDDNNDDGDDDDEWFIPQSVQSENPYVSLNNSKYGFANKISRALDAFEVCIIQFPSL